MTALHRDDGFFDETLESRDPEVFDAISKELGRQRDEIELIASENIVSAAVMEAQGSVMTNKYAEGYPAKRYYGGCENVDIAEQLAIDRAKALFGADYANVQPHSGSQANAAVYFALLNAGDTVLGMSLAHGGHLTHGAKVSFSGRLFNFVHYGVDRETQIIDYGNDYPEGISKSYGQVSYAELKSGSIKLNGKEIPTVPLSSMVKARKIAEILKNKISQGKFTLGEPQFTLPS